jgi:hypothetical protein
VNATPQSNLVRIRAAAEALRREIVDDPVALSASLEEPIPVCNESDQLDSWFVALTTDDLLVGFLQLESDLSLHRYSTFQRTRGSITDCPPAATWLDTTRIRERARSALAGNKQLGQPILSYLDNRDRLAWRVPVGDGQESVYVIGDDVNVDVT